MCRIGTTLSAIYNAEEWIGEEGFSLPGSNWPILYMPMMRKHFGFKNGKRDTICWDSTVCLMQGWENYKFISFNLPTNHMNKILPFLFFFFFFKELLVVNPALCLLHKYLLWNERTPISQMRKLRFRVVRWLNGGLLSKCLWLPRQTAWLCTLVQSGPGSEHIALCLSLPICTWRQ